MIDDIIRVAQRSVSLVGALMGSHGHIHTQTGSSFSLSLQNPLGRLVDLTNIRETF